jgi:hypothetical protein
MKQTLRCALIAIPMPAGDGRPGKWSVVMRPYDFDATIGVLGRNPDHDTAIDDAISVKLHARASRHRF